MKAKHIFLAVSVIFAAFIALNYMVIDSDEKFEKDLTEIVEQSKTTGPIPLSTVMPGEWSTVCFTWGNCTAIKSHN